MVSRDEGTRWGWPRTIIDSDLDDRDPGLLETSHGTLIVTMVNSLAYESILADVERGNPSSVLPPSRVAAWQAASDRLTADKRRAQLGPWTIRSADGGLSWSGPSRCQVNSPHGPIALQDGRLLYLGKEVWAPHERIGVCESIDDGLSWQWLAEIPTRMGDRVDDYHELHGVEAANGTIIAHIRNHNPANLRETLQSESHDGGRSWSAPHAIGVLGRPSHLLRLKDDRLLMTYAYRLPPFGNQARVSDDCGRSWSELMVINGDGDDNDIGYPSTCQLPDGSLVTVWYESMEKRGGKAVLRQAWWELTG